MASQIFNYLTQIFVVVVLVTICIIGMPKFIMSSNISKTSTNTIGTCRADEGKLYYVRSNEAKCMDGSHPAYYFRKGVTNNNNKLIPTTKWHVHFEGGGWCYQLNTCLERQNMRLGSSLSYTPCMSSDFKDYLSNQPQENPLMSTWNHVLVKYCDGASYAGNSIQEYNGTKIFFKGMHNRDDTIRDLLETKGMNQATEIVISGCSAGGLGIYLGIDQIASIINHSNSSIKVKAMVDSGYFPAYSSDENWISENEYPEALIGKKMDFAQSMKNVFHFAGVRHGAHPECVKNSTTPENCIFAQYLTPHIKTPIFSLQPQYDHWQIWHILGKPMNFSLVNSFGSNLTKSMKQTLLSRDINGLYIDSCIHHCTKCSKADSMWHGGEIRSTKESFTEADAFQKWYLRTEETARKEGALLYMQEGMYPCHNCCKCVI